MKYKWLQKLNNDKLIIFFNGWGMDEHIVSELDPDGYDVVVLYDYNDLNLDIDFSEYEEKHIVAWSMGVMTATLFEFENIKSATAICGTPYSVNDKYGIPERIYNLTIRGFSESSAEKFMARMFKEKTNLQKYSDRTLESQKSELISLLKYKPNEDFVYTRAIIADSDLIIPTKNQQNYWVNTTTKTETISSGHCPFGLYKKWTELL